MSPLLPNSPMLFCTGFLSPLLDPRHPNWLSVCRVFTRVLCMELYAVHDKHTMMDLQIIILTEKSQTKKKVFFRKFLNSEFCGNIYACVLSREDPIICFRSIFS